MMLGDRWEPAKGLEHLVFTTMFGKPLLTLSVGSYSAESGAELSRTLDNRCDNEHLYPCVSGIGEGGDQEDRKPVLKDSPV